MKNTGHNASGKAVGYAYCVKCGLMYLKNDATRQAIKAPCPADLDDKPKRKS